MSRPLSRLALAVLVVCVLARCSCTTYSNRLWIGHRPHLKPPFSESDLRPVPNPALRRVARALGFFTTPFKRLGVLGWRDVHIDAVAVGVVEQVATSTDHFVTTDLRLIELTANGATVELTSPRYLRAEICARKLRLAKAALPCEKDKVRIAGQVMWDSDGNGFLELHPQQASDVEILERAGACGVSPRE
jgi:hypothetical protein